MLVVTIERYLPTIIVQLTPEHDLFLFAFWTITTTFYLKRTNHNLNAFTRCDCVWFSKIQDQAQLQRSPISPAMSLFIKLPCVMAFRLPSSTTKHD